MFFNVFRRGKSKKLSSVLNKLPFTWDTAKNKGLDPSKLTTGSGKEAYWRCSRGHSFKRTIYSATRTKYCPKCPKYEDIAKVRPQLVKEWMKDKNGCDIKYAHSYDRAYWKCSKCGHEWIATLNGRNIKNTGCPACAKKADTKRKSFAVLQYSLDNEFIREWYSISEAARELKLNKSNIAAAVRGVHKSAGGYKWIRK